ncbi:MAG: hypothetical protein HOH03_08950 [Candidatus Marinimicrobia bacterium]|jgi:hypothetical protein|nr:hypothetical protein [Candidatus Neomarinimicrobiota bacterium]
MSATKPFFIPQQEINLIDSMNEELIDEILGQYVDIYKISVEKTEANIYGESSTKYYNVGFRVNCMLNYNEPETLQDEFGADVNSSIDLYFQRNNLASGSLNFYPEIGDIVDWNQHLWEIGSVTEPQLIGGHQGFKHNVAVSAHRSRLSSLQIESRPL